MSMSGEASAELQAAWNEVHLATPPNWTVGLPSQRHGGSWEMYAFDQTEKPKIGRRDREWTATGQTEEECIREMGALSAGDWRGAGAEVNALT